MNFLSVHFLVFLPIVTVLHFSIGPRGRRVLLLLASWYFYAVFSVPLLSLLLFSTLLDHTAAIHIEDSDDPSVRRRWLMLSIVGNLSILGLFKYLGFFMETADTIATLLGLPHVVVWHLVLPMGISFYTFQTMSYTIDVYRGHTPASRSLLDTALYVAFFPQLVAGPIMRPGDLMPQFHAVHTLDWDRIRSGALLVMWGMLKKAYVADPMGRIVGRVYEDPGRWSWLALILATYAFAVQIYCDFSAYSDIARGSGRVLGYEVMVNFRTPYLADSLRDFWRRWHISLSTWLRDYLYVPLGGNRHGEAMTYRNLFLTMLLGGLWHGASWNFVIWGALHGGGLAVERRLLLDRLGGTGPIARLLRGVVVLHFVCLAWVFFRAETLAASAAIVGRIASFAPGEAVGPAPAIVLGGLLVVQAWLQRENLVLRFLEQRPLLARWTLYAAILLVVSLLSRQSSPDFIYFQF